jgi:hypothetical protein
MVMTRDCCKSGDIRKEHRYFGVSTTDLGRLPRSSTPNDFNALAQRVQRTSMFLASAGV